MNIAPRPTVFAAVRRRRPPFVRHLRAHDFTPETTRSTPARSRLRLHVGKPASPTGRGGVGLPFADLEHRARRPAPAAPARRPPAGARGRARPGRRRARGGARPGPRGAARRDGRSGCTGGSPRSARTARARRAARQIALHEGDRCREPLRVRARHLERVAETSLANTTASERSLARVIASAPEPVPTSAMRAAAAGSPHGRPGDLALPRSASRCRGGARGPGRRPRTRASRTPSCRPGTRPTHRPDGA